MAETIGEKLSPVLKEIEETIWDFEYDNPTQQSKYTEEGFRAAIKIFMSGIMDKMWDYQEEDKVPMKERYQQATEAGKAIRVLIKKYTDIDSHDLYKPKIRT